VTKNRIQRTVRMCLLSTFLALALFSFLAFGSGSAHALTRSASAAQTASSSTTTTRVIVNKAGQRVFSPNTISVKSGNSVKIVNKTAFELILFTNQGITRLAPVQSLTMTITQSQNVGICGGGSLTITAI
jgi:plastocyanin